MTIHEHPESYALASNSNNPTPMHDQNQTNGRLPSCAVNSRSRGEP